MQEVTGSSPVPPTISSLRADKALIFLRVRLFAIDTIDNKGYLSEPRTHPTEAG